MSATKYEVKLTSQFKKDYKAAIKRNCDMKHLQNVIIRLANGEKLEEKYCLLLCEALLMDVHVQRFLRLQIKGGAKTDLDYENSRW